MENVYKHIWLSPLLIFPRQSMHDMHEILGAELALPPRQARRRLPADCGRARVPAPGRRWARRPALEQREIQVGGGRRCQQRRQIPDQQARGRLQPRGRVVRGSGRPLRRGLPHTGLRGSGVGKDREPGGVGGGGGGAGGGGVSRLSSAEQEYHDRDTENLSGMLWSDARGLRSLRGQASSGRRTTCGRLASM